jgi:hypothetical protein
LFITALPSGDTLELASVAHYDEAIPRAHQMTNVPEDWTITIVEAKPTEIRMAWAASEVTPDEIKAGQQRTVTALNIIPKPAACFKSVMVKVVYHHINEHRKPDHTYVNVRADNDQSKQELLDEWIRRVRSGVDHQEPWLRRAQKMNRKESDYL